MISNAIVSTPRLIALTIIFSFLCAILIYFAVPQFGLTNNGHCDPWWYFGLSVYPEHSRFTHSMAYHYSRLPTYIIQHVLFLAGGDARLGQIVAVFIPWLLIAIFFGARTMKIAPLAIFISIAYFSPLILSVSSASHNAAVPAIVSAMIVLATYIAHRDSVVSSVIFGFSAAIAIYSNLVAGAIVLPLCAAVFIARRSAIPGALLGFALATGLLQAIHVLYVGRSGFFYNPSIKFLIDQFLNLSTENPWSKPALIDSMHGISIAIMAVLGIAAASLKEDLAKVDLLMRISLVLSSLFLTAYAIINRTLLAYDYYSVFIVPILAYSAALVSDRLNPKLNLSLVAGFGAICICMAYLQYSPDRSGLLDSNLTIQALFLGLFLSAMLVAGSGMYLVQVFSRTSIVLIALSTVTLVSGKNKADGFWWVSPQNAMGEYDDVIFALSLVRQSVGSARYVIWSEGSETDRNAQFYAIRALGACRISYTFPEAPGSFNNNIPVSSAGALILFTSNDTVVENAYSIDDAIFTLTTEAKVPSGDYRISIFTKPQ